MENKIMENNSSNTPVGEQILLTTPQPDQLNITPQRNYSFHILIALLLIVVVGVSIYLLTYNQSAKKQIVPPTNSSTTVSNPNTGDLYQDINVRMKELLP